jgi:hypothetical protein
MGRRRKEEAREARLDLAGEDEGGASAHALGLGATAWRGKTGRGVVAAMWR